MKRGLSSHVANVRVATAAGRFYPQDPIELRALIESLLANASSPAGPPPKAIIAPHAGYHFSGPVAASAYLQLRPLRNVVKRVVLIGPSHYAAFRGVALCAADAFATPLGLVPVDRTSVETLADLPTVSVRPEPHAPEHSLEVHLPFLQIILNAFTLVPLLAGEATADEISEVLDRLWGGPETRLVISSDLSHYLDSDTARRVDQATARTIESLDPERLGDQQACGQIPIRGLLRSARRHHLCARSLDLRNSGDTAGPREEVVGYGAFSFVDELPKETSRDQ
jgi:AmmeMemoRadiSam system protein B